MNLTDRKKMKPAPARERAAGQEADRAKAALRNTRKGYGQDRSTQDIDRAGESPQGDTAGEVARRQGEHEG